MRRYPVFASRRSLESYIALEGEILTEPKCLERAAEIASLQFTSRNQPGGDLSWGWIVGLFLAVGMLAFPVLLGSALPFLLLTAVVALGLLFASLQLRPFLAALNTRHAVTWRGRITVSTRDEMLHVAEEPQSYEESVLQLQHLIEHELEPEGGDNVGASPARAATKPLVTVGFGLMVEDADELWALDSLDGLSIQMRGRLFRRRRYAFQLLARDLLPDVFLLGGTLAYGVSASLLALTLPGAEIGWGFVFGRVVQLGIGLAAGRAFSSAFHLLRWVPLARQRWAIRAMEERLVVAGIAGVPDRVLGELARARQGGRTFVTPEEYARQWSARPAPLPAGASHER